MIYFDLDEVLRDLHTVVNFVPQNWDDNLPNGQNFIQCLDNNLELLRAAPLTKYARWIPPDAKIQIVTRQPHNWVPYTKDWIHTHFHNAIITFVNEPEDKIKMLKKGDILIEDYPFFSDYSRVILIDYPYNRIVEDCLFRIKSVGEFKRVLVQGGIEL